MSFSFNILVSHSSPDEISKMKLALKFVTIWALFELSSVSSQVNHLECVFTFTANGDAYRCFLLGITIADEPEQTVTIGGTHLDGLNNADVRGVEIRNSHSPYIITQLFTTFPNLQTFEITYDDGLTRIQSGAFTGAIHLEAIHISYCWDTLTTVEDNAFIGAANLKSLDLSSNLIETIYENAFEGLQEVTSLHLQRNQLQQLPASWLRSLPNLVTFEVYQNYITSLDGDVFVHNPNISLVNFDDNLINAVERNFLDSLPSLPNVVQVGLQNNVCVNDFWVINSQSQIDEARRGLSRCFDNFRPDEEVKKYILELRGSLVLRSEDGSEIIEL